MARDEDCASSSSLSRRTSPCASFSAWAQTRGWGRRETTGAVVARREREVTDEGWQGGGRDRVPQGPTGCVDELEPAEAARERLVEPSVCVVDEGDVAVVDPS